MLKYTKNKQQWWVSAWMGHSFLVVTAIIFKSKSTIESKAQWNLKSPPFNVATRTVYLLVILHLTNVRWYLEIFAIFCFIQCSISVLKAHTPSYHCLVQKSLNFPKILNCQSRVILLKFVILRHFVVCGCFVFGTFFMKVWRFPKPAYGFIKTTTVYCRTLTPNKIVYPSHCRKKSIWTLCNGLYARKK